MTFRRARPISSYRPAFWSRPALRVACSTRDSAASTPWRDGSVSRVDRGAWARSVDSSCARLSAHLARAWSVNQNYVRTGCPYNPADPGLPGKHHHRTRCLAMTDCPRAARALGRWAARAPGRPLLAGDEGLDLTKRRGVWQRESRNGRSPSTASNGRSERWTVGRRQCFATDRIGRLP